MEKYQYTKNNNYDSIEKYEFSKYQGPIFFSQFNLDRKNHQELLLLGLDKKNNDNSLFEEYCKNISPSNLKLNMLIELLHAKISPSSKSSNQPNRLSSNDLLINHLSLYLNKERRFNSNDLLLIFTKKYELFRRIYPYYVDLYPPDNDKRVGDYKIPLTYILLSLCNLVDFSFSNNLILFNTSLKINDFLCSIFDENFSSSETFFLLLVLEIEKLLVSSFLSSEKI